MAAQRLEHEDVAAIVAELVQDGRVVIEVAEGLRFVTNLDAGRRRRQDVVAIDDTRPAATA